MGSLFRRGGPRAWAWERPRGWFARQICHKSREGSFMFLRDDDPGRTVGDSGHAAKVCKAAAQRRKPCQVTRFDVHI